MILIFANNQLFAYDCLGAKDSKQAIVYLHGMDTEPPGALELSNRDKLKKIASNTGVGFALARAKKKCPTQPGLLCWGWDFNDQKAIDSAFSEAENAKEYCFSEATTLGLIGFSNGGYIVNYALKNCKNSDFKWFISIGAGSTWADTSAKDLSTCGEYTFMAGNKDSANFETIKKMTPWLSKRKANFKIVEYSGGHALPAEELETEIKNLINTDK